jgi:hypothetical protein
MVAGQTRRAKSKSDGGSIVTTNPSSRQDAGAPASADQATQASPGAATASPPYGECPSRCGYCTDSDGEQWLPMYGVAPHECFWRKGPQFTLGQSTLVPFTPNDCFVPDLDTDEDWSAFVYPHACGVYYCPQCQDDKYRAAWARLIERIGDPPASAGEAQRAETTKIGSVHERAVREAQTPKGPRP